MKAKRMSNLELLRIISILMIIAFHATRVTEFKSMNAVPWDIKLVNVFIGSWGILGVDLFVIISAWFMVDSKHSFGKIVDILVQTITYVVLFGVAFIFYDFSKYQFSSIKSPFADLLYYELKFFADPLWSQQYWFVTAYLTMLLVSPLLNKLVNTTGKNRLRNILILFIFIPLFAQTKTSIVCDAVSFCYIYTLVGYIKRYHGGGTGRKHPYQICETEIYCDYYICFDSCSIGRCLYRKAASFSTGCD